MDKGPKEIQVAAYSGFKANERPLSFNAEDGAIVRVKHVLDRWYGPEYDYFKILGENGRLYLLRWHRRLDHWQLLKIYERTFYH